MTFFVYRNKLRLGVDDGAQSLKESLLMATPHTLNGIYINSETEVTSKVTSLQETLSENHIKLQLYEWC